MRSCFEGATRKQHHLTAHPASISLRSPPSLPHQEDYSMSQLVRGRDKDHLSNHVIHKIKT